MIDTDKYEGHTPAPWTLSEEYAYELFIYAGGVRLAKMDGNAPLYLDEHGNPEDLNAQLIADAPLLLAEVKRLRQENDELHAQRVQFSWIQEARGGQSDAPLLLEEVKRWHKVRDYILEKASYPTVKKLHLKDLLNFMEEVGLND